MVGNLPSVGIGYIDSFINRYKMKNKRVVAFFATAALSFYSLATMASDSIPIIKYYYKVNCSWCDKQKPILERISANRLAIIKPINCDGSFIPTPTMRIIVNGKVVKTFVGYTSFEDLVGALQ